jgi:aquaporin Z
MVGTFWLVLGGCGSAVLAAAFPGLGIGFAGVALAFGLSVLTMAYALGGLSGAHFNPPCRRAVAGAAPGGRPAYCGQVRALLAGGVLYAIAAGAPGFSPAAGFAANGMARIHRRLRLPSAAVCELVLTCGFLLVIMGVTDKNARPRVSRRWRSGLR